MQRRTRRFAVVLAALLLLVIVLGGAKALQFHQMMAAASTRKPPPESITTAVVTASDWPSVLTATGTVLSVQGVTVAAELPGKVVQIAFQPGARAKAGQLLVRQDTDVERAQLRAAVAKLTLARLNLARTARLLARRVVAQSQYDDIRAQADQAAAEADAARAAIRKKTIRAPFDGRLGIRLVNLGQVISTGTPIVSLQSIDPVFVNFTLPQQQLAAVDRGVRVRLTGTALPQALEGTITALNPHVDPSTRNVELQATVSNPQERLRPGMFVDVAVMLPSHRRVLAIPGTAILYAPYGDSVFVVQGERSGRPTVRQQLVRLGERRGDFVAVLSGLREGQRVASTGVFKLRNGQPVTIDNALSPRFQLAPKPADS